MPFAKCPNCGQGFHLHIKGTPVWPDEPNQEKEMLCAGCWLEVRVGDRVYFISEKPLTFHADNLGTVLEKALDQQEEVFRIQFEAGRMELLPREKIYIDLKQRYHSITL